MRSFTMRSFICPICPLSWRSSGNSANNIAPVTAPAPGTLKKISTFASAFDCFETSPLSRLSIDFSCEFKCEMASAIGCNVRVSLVLLAWFLPPKVIALL